MKKYEIYIWGPLNQRFIRASRYDTLAEAEAEKMDWLSIEFMSDNRVKIIEVEID